MDRRAKQLLIGGVVAGAAVVVLGLIGNVLFGDEQGGAADILHLVQMLFLLACPLLVLCGGGLALVRRSSQRNGVSR